MECCCATEAVPISVVPGVGGRRVSLSDCIHELGLWALLAMGIAGCVGSASQCRLDPSEAPTMAARWPIDPDARASFLSDELDRMSADFQCGRREMAAMRAEQINGALSGDQLDWYFDEPNAVHFAHTVLGLEALRVGDRVRAERHLLASVPDRGSPQLKTFGPSMALASGLLAAGNGARETVLTYLDALAPIWPSGQAYLAARRAEIESGAPVQFGWQEEFVGR